MDKMMKPNDGLLGVISADKLSLAFTCRTCLSTNSDQQLIPIFEDIKSSGKFDTLDQLLLLNPKITKNDGYPSNICKICVGRLEAVDAFRKQCEMAQEYLEQNFAMASKIEPDLDVEYSACFAEDLEPLNDSRDSDPPEDCDIDDQLIAKEECKETIKIITNDERTPSEEKPYESSDYRRPESPDECSENSKNLYRCSHCDETFNHKSHWKSHKLSHQGKQSYLCNFCGKSFLRKDNLKWHLKAHKGEVEQYTCDICNKTYPRKDSLKIHLEIHLNKRKYQCDKCGMKFNHQNTLKGHVKLHNLEKMHQCEFCEESFRHNFALKRHRLMVHNKTEESVQKINEEASQKKGDDGGSIDEKKAPLVQKEVAETPPKKRRKRPTEYKPYICETCGKAYKVPSALENHVKTHNDKKRKYVCKDCGDAFFTIVHLQNHVNAIHLNYRPFSCEICGKAFFRVGDRDRHKITHTKEKPYNCTICGKGFAWNRSLKAHIRDHTGEKPYVCIICNAGFARHENLARHTRIAHIEVEMKIRKGKSTSDTSPVQGI